MFGMRCAENGIEHRLTKVRHPWTNGHPFRQIWLCQIACRAVVERMNRTIKDATVKRFHYDSHDQLRAHLRDFLAAYNFARRLKTLGGLTPYEYICKISTNEPERFNLDPTHQIPGLNS
jgi:transposase InsO family protein